MAEEKLTDNDDDDDAIEIVEVDTLPKGDPEPKPEPKEDSDEDDDEDEQQEDARLVESDDEDEDDEPSVDPKTLRNRKNRAKRRAIQRHSETALKEKVDSLARQNEELLRRLHGVETTTLATGEADVDRRLAEVRRDIETADAILARSIEAANGADAAAAIRLRDEARAAEASILKTKESFAEARKPQTQVADPRVAALAAQWKQANPWYGQPGNEERTAIVNAIDHTMKEVDRLNAADIGYFAELTRRANAYLDGGKPAGDRAVKDKKKAPPQGSGREHAPDSTRKEVYVTPDRKAAMIEAGVWDDPVRRARVLKAYAEQDRSDRSAG